MARARNGKCWPTFVQFLSFCLAALGERITEGAGEYRVDRPSRTETYFNTPVSNPNRALVKNLGGHVSPTFPNRFSLPPCQRTDLVRFCSSFVRCILARIFPWFPFAVPSQSVGAYPNPPLFQAYATVMYDDFTPEVSSIHAILSVNGNVSGVGVFFRASKAFFVRRKKLSTRSCLAARLPFPRFLFRAVLDMTCGIRCL